jgi:PPOX class probable F420-dependent enzyme
MTTRQGDVALLDDPVAQQLLQAATPARLAYTWTDGTPRVVPIWFHWDGQEFVLATPPRTPKLRALAAQPKVALTIDADAFPYHVLLVRGTARASRLDEIVPEYALMARRYFGAGADAWLQQIGAMLPSMGGMTRIAITPEWVSILDFEQRFPRAIEHAMSAAS